MRKISGLLIILILIILVSSMFSGCNATNGQLYTLDEAYDNGWISQEDLRSISYYWNNKNADPSFIPAPIIPSELDPKVDKKIRKAYLQNFNRKYGYGKAKLSNIHIYRYYGTYGDCPIIRVSDDILQYDYYFEEQVYIGDVLFTKYCAGLI
ncbi:MAG: hypothetical protein K2M36_03655, partial [Clostridia bacterium]|nr:hypothetical protein [Clostridia bacterium]